MQPSDEAARYLKSCQSVFWQNVFKAELEYLLRHIRQEDKILSVGCGPALMETSLIKRGFDVVGLDVSEEALKAAPDQLRKVVCRAEDMPFAEGTFDVVIYMVSLQFIEDYRKAIVRTASVLKPEGRLIVMLLNPESEFFINKYSDKSSYVSKLRHTDLNEIEICMAELFELNTEYFMGVSGEELFESSNTETAVLYLIRGIKKQMPDSR